MMRFLDGLALLKEVDSIEGAAYTSEELKMMFPDKVIVMRHTPYIYKEVLCEVSKKGVTNLDNYIPMGELAESLKTNKETWRDRINFMEKTGSRFFDYKRICNQTFIYIDDEYKHLAQHYQPFVARLEDGNRIVKCKLIGDIKVGFY